MRVFLDANILFSAAKTDGALRELLTLLARSGHRCCADAYVIEEARRNLEAKAPEQAPLLDTLLSRITTAGPRRIDPTLEASLPLPAKDRPVLAAAVHLRCDALLTSDRTHFSPVYERTIRGATIHSPWSLARAVIS